MTEVEDDDFVEGVAAPIVITQANFPYADREWAEYTGLNHLNVMREGATFTQLSERVWIIGVYGAQLLHHDRHMANGDCWNFVVSGSETQGLILETAPKIFEHHDLKDGTLLYFNTTNLHAVTRRNPRDTVILLQATGYGPDEREEAVAEMRRVCAIRQNQTAKESQ